VEVSRGAGGVVEAGDPAGGAEAGRSVVTRTARAQVAHCAAAVAPAGHVVEGRRRREVGLGRRVTLLGRRAGEGVGRRDHRGGRAGPPENQPTGLVVAGRAVVDRNSGVGVRDRGHVGDGAPLGAAGVVLPRGFRVVQGAAAPRADSAGGAGTPDVLVPPAGAGVPRQAGTADRSDVLRRRGIFDAVAGIPRAGGDGHPGMVVVLRVKGGLRTGLRGAVAVGHGDRAESDRRIHRRAQVIHRGGIRLHQQDGTVRAGGGDHVQIQRGLLRPAGVHRRRSGAAGLVDLGETAGTARRQAVLAPVGGQVGPCGGRVVGVDDGDGDSATRRGGG